MLRSISLALAATSALAVPAVTAEVASAHRALMTTTTKRATTTRTTTTRTATTTSSTSQKLQWAPPAQTNPVVVNVPTGYYGATFPTDRDVVLVMPSQTRSSNINVSGGHNIRLIGGSTVFNTTNGSTAVIRFSGVSGSVFIEGTNIDVNGHRADGINVSGSSSAPYTLFPDVYIENSRIVGLNSTFTRVHADIFQPQGSVGRVYIDKLTGQSNYQGLFMPPQFPIAAAHLSRINLSYGPGGQRWTYLLWFLDPSTNETPYPISMSNVWVAPRSGQTVASDAVAPWSGALTASGQQIGAVSSGTEQVTWPSFAQITGAVSSGAPSTGDFVPVGSVGIGYWSPGYLS